MSKPIPQKIDVEMKASRSSTNDADARGRSRAIAAFINKLPYKNAPIAQEDQSFVSGLFRITRETTSSRLAEDDPLWRDPRAAAA